MNVRLTIYLKICIVYHVLKTVKQHIALIVIFVQEYVVLVKAAIILENSIGVFQIVTKPVARIVQAVILVPVLVMLAQAVTTYPAIAVSKIVTRAAAVTVQTATLVLENVELVIVVIT